MSRESLGEFEQAVLLAVAHLDDAYGVTIRREIERRTERDVAVGALYTALERLAAVDEKLARVVELRYFAGLSEQEIAELMDRSERSVRRDWQKARMFLLAAMRED